ncbi:MAG: hypothetical protein ACK5AO_00705 [bacterium]|jgi:hypothetical protein
MTEQFHFNSVHLLNKQIKDELMVVHPTQPISSSTGQMIRQKIRLHETVFPSCELSDTAINAYLERWLLLMRYHHILLVFNDDQDSARARYDFITSVIFDMVLPPHPPEMQFCFVYDSIADRGLVENPDQLMRLVLEPILNKDKISRFHCIHKRIRLNTFDNLSEPELHYLIGRYQQRYDSISSISVTLSDKKLVNNRILFFGRHETGYCLDTYCNIIRGKWEIELLHENHDWRVVNIQIEGVEF